MHPASARAFLFLFVTGEGLGLSVAGFGEPTALDT